MRENNSSFSETYMLTKGEIIMLNNVKKFVIKNLIALLWYVPVMYIICKFVDWFAETKLFNDVFDKFFDYFWYKD